MVIIHGEPSWAIITPTVFYSSVEKIKMVTVRGLSVVIVPILGYITVFLKLQ